jgi:type I restriction-modification system DNA methylase subunit
MKADWKTVRLGDLILTNISSYSEQSVSAYPSIRPLDIAKTADTFDRFAKGKFKPEKGFSAVVKTAEIAGQDYIFTPGRLGAIGWEV